MKEITLDCTGIADKKQLHQALYETLALPEWYGHNLDALFDCLTECDETHLTLLHWDELGDWNESFASVFEDAAVENEYFTYTIV